MVHIKNKDWYKSKTVWAAVFSAFIVILSAVIGETSPIISGLVAVGSAVGLYGRFGAVTKLQ